MSTIQNFKNFLRHGKQARVANSPHAEPTTNVQSVHAHYQRYDQYGAPNQQFSVTDPSAYDYKPLQAGTQVQGDYSGAAVDNSIAAAIAGDHRVKQAHQAVGVKDRKADLDPSVIERIVTEERVNKTKMPRYRGLERYTLIEKMGDGAFSNVYRAKDNTEQFGEVAIKVVRKFEMNTNQVCSNQSSLLHLFVSPVCFAFTLEPSLYDCVASFCQYCERFREIVSFIRIIRRRQRQ